MSSVDFNFSRSRCFLLLHLLNTFLTYTLTWEWCYITQAVLPGGRAGISVQALVVWQRGHWNEAGIVTANVCTTQAYQAVLTGFHSGMSLNTEIGCLPSSPSPGTYTKGVLWSAQNPLYWFCERLSHPFLSIRVDQRGRSCDYWVYGSDTPLYITWVLQLLCHENLLDHMILMWCIW